MTLGGAHGGHDLKSKLEQALGDLLSPAIQRAVLETSARRRGVDLTCVPDEELPHLLAEVRRGVRLFGLEARLVEQCLHALDTITQATEARRSEPVGLPIRTEQDILRARQAVREICRSIGFTETARMKITTAVSELTRNIVLYAGSGELLARQLSEPRLGLEVVATDNGPGIADIDSIMEGRYRSKRGMGAGLRGTRALVDQFDIRTGPGGTTVTFRTYLR
jgi:serine/threonine-protein kinase RsbT